jgi:hypothetical protein
VRAISHGVLGVLAAACSQGVERACCVPHVQNVIIFSSTLPPIHLHQTLLLLLLLQLLLLLCIIKMHTSGPCSAYVLAHSPYSSTTQTPIVLLSLLHFSCQHAMSSFTTQVLRHASISTHIQDDTGTTQPACCLTSPWSLLLLLLPDQVLRSAASINTPLQGDTPRHSQHAA